MNKIAQIRKNLKDLEARGHQVILAQYDNLVTIVHKDTNECYIVNFETRGVRYPGKVLNPKSSRWSAEKKLIDFITKSV